MNEDENNEEEEFFEDDDEETEEEESVYYSEMGVLTYQNFSIANVREDDRKVLVADLYVDVEGVTNGKTLIGKEVNVGFIGFFINSNFTSVSLESLMNEIVSYSVTRDEEKLDTHLRYLQYEFMEVSDVINRFATLVGSHVNVLSIFPENPNTD